MTVGDVTSQPLFLLAGFGISRQKSLGFLEISHFLREYGPKVSIFLSFKTALSHNTDVLVFLSAQIACQNKSNPKPTHDVISR